MTEASCIVRRTGGSRRSMRAVSSDRTLPGRPISSAARSASAEGCQRRPPGSRRSAPLSSRVRTVSSTKNGLPSALRSMRS